MNEFDRTIAGAPVDLQVEASLRSEIDRLKLQRVQAISKQNLAKNMDATEQASAYAVGVSGVASAALRRDVIRLRQRLDAFRVKIVTDEIWARTTNGLCLLDSNGVKGICVEAGGQVGIGTNTPSQLLELATTGDTTDTGLAIKSDRTSFVVIYSDFDNDATDSDGKILFRLHNNTANDWTIGVDDSDTDKLKFGLSNTIGTSTMVTFDRSGNVGIGTAAPGQKLDVQGNITLGDGSAGCNLMINGGAGTSRDVQYRTAGVNRWLVRCDGTTETGSNVGSNFSINSRQDDGTALATPLTITRNNSNIGIRQATPQAILHVGGGADTPTSANVTIYASNAGATAIAARDSTNDIEVKMGAGTTLAFMGSVTNHALQIMVNNAEVARFDTNGRLGIGISPSKMLHVFGTILADGDEGGVAGTTGFTDINDLTANSTGVGTILFKGTTNRNSTGFIKIYVGTTAYYIPVFAAITG